MAEYVSSNGGTSFTLQTHAVSWAPESDGTAGPIVPLLGGDFGAGYVTPNSNPAFQANSLSSPSDDSEGNAASYATLNPAPASAYTVGNLGGEFASQVTGSTGVLGVFEARPAPATRRVRRALRPPWSTPTHRSPPRPRSPS